jgi:photosystem II stability/assembly factor-like uncharacterized protein
MGCKGTDYPTELNSPQGDWKLVRDAQAGYFHGLWFADRNNGWVVGDSGRILNTSDGGDSWNVQESGTVTSLQCVSFANALRGWVGAGNNMFGTTTNGGTSWIWQHPIGDSRRTFLAMSFIDENTGWVVDNYGGILHSEDGGITWTPQASGTNWAITSVQFLDSKEGWATATHRVVLHTTDGGNNWTTRGLDDLFYGRGVVVVYQDIYFVNRVRGWVATNSALSGTDFHPTPIVNTSDAGTTWSCQSTPEGDFITAIVFADENIGWAEGSGGILHTNDGGGRWTYELQSHGALFVDICFVDRSHSWALTFTGNIYRYQSG